jgi:hypothetical protein
MKTERQRTKHPNYPSTITALKVQQWLSSWNEVQFDIETSQAKPSQYFYIFRIKAGHLKALTGVYRRSVEGGKPRSIDPNVQRGHEEERSATIREFVKFGYPWCEMGATKRRQQGAADLRKPGWLPTAIVVNILPPGSERNGVKIPEVDLMRVTDGDTTSSLHLPQGFTGSNWVPRSVYPLEVIDGQHRLWAFDGFDPGDDFELPVVAYYGLDRGWQAYLFWSINITPKRINRSLAFDLYPLLRKQTWLDKFMGHSIYRQTRCQELVEALWSHPESPWQYRINMLGEPKDQRDYKGPMVTQAAWVRSLMTTFVKQSEGAGTRIGGLFGAPPSADSPLLPWNRAMQAAVLIYSGNAVKKHIKESRAKWAEHLRRENVTELNRGDDQAFYGEFSLISTDQGIRGLLFTINDLCFVHSKKLSLAEWRDDDVHRAVHDRKPAATDEAWVSAALKSFALTKAADFIKKIAEGIASYDWRTSSTPELERDQQLRQSVFRGSSGYKEMRHQLLIHLSEQGGELGKAATAVIRVLGYK